MTKNIMFDRIKTVSVVLSILVICVHAFNVYDFKPTDFSSSANIYLQHFISNGIARVTSPMFFIISGFLFFREIDFEKSDYVRKVKNRFHSLFIPYMFWASSILVVYIILQEMPIMSRYFKGDFLHNLNLDLMYKIYIEPLNYPLWFVRELLYFTLISPIFYLCIKYIPKITLVLLALAWYANVCDSISISFFKPRSMLFFAFGVYVALHKRELLIKKMPKNTFYTCVFIYFFIISTDAYFNTYGAKWSYLTSFLHKSGIILGIALLWQISDRLKNSSIKKLAKYTFIFYVFHEPAVSFIRMGSFLEFGKSANVSFVVYIFTPFVVVFSLILFSNLFSKYMPKIYHLTTGGR